MNTGGTCQSNGTTAGYSPTVTGGVTDVYTSLKNEISIMSTTFTELESEEDTLSTTLIALYISIVFVVIVLIAVGTWWCCKKRKSRNGGHSFPDDPDNVEITAQKTGTTSNGYSHTAD